MSSGTTLSATFAAAVSALAAVAPGVAFAGEAARPPALTVAEVRGLIVRPDCGGVSDASPEGVALRERMVAKLRQESGFRPYAIRSETEGRGIVHIATETEAIAEATRRLDRGETLGLGLGQITGSANLLGDFGAPDIATAVRLAFRPCKAVRAAVRHYAADVRYAMRVLDCASASYQAGPRRVCEDTPYVRSVRALQAALPAFVPIAAPSPMPRPPVRRASPPAATVEVLLPVPAESGATDNREIVP